MATFWDKFVFRVFAGFGEEYPPGLNIAGALLETAHKLGLLQLRELSDQSLARIVLCGQANSRLCEAANHALQSHPKMPRGELASILLNSCPRRLADLLGIAESGSFKRALVCDILWQHYGQQLIDFLCRLLLAEPEPQRSEILLDQALEEYSVIGEADFPCHLYRHVWAKTPRREPTQWPSQLPEWYAQLEPAEQTFLRCCFKSLDDRRGLFLSFYAGLNVEQITCVFRAVKRPQWYQNPLLRRLFEILGSWPPKHKQVLQHLEASWGAVLQCMAT